MDSNPPHRHSHPQDMVSRKRHLKMVGRHHTRVLPRRRMEWWGERTREPFLPPLETILPWNLDLLWSLDVEFWIFDV
jgi:hypothetical protein